MSVGYNCEQLNQLRCCLGMYSGRPKEPCTRHITTTTPHHSIFTSQTLFPTPNQLKQLNQLRCCLGMDSGSPKEPCTRHITTTTPHHSIFTSQTLFPTPNQQRKSTEGQCYQRPTRDKIPNASASEVTTLRRYTNLFISIIIILSSPAQSCMQENNNNNNDRLTAFDPGQPG